MSGTRTDSALLAALRQKTGVSRQRLHQRAQDCKTKLPMSTPEAIYTIAFEEGIDITAYLDSEETARVRALVAQLRATSPRGGEVTPTRQAKARPRRAPKPTLVTIAGLSVERLPGMSAGKAREAETMASKVYPALYVFENSARELISAILRQALGEGWWDQVVPRKVRDAAMKRKEGEADDPWHGRRGSQMIDYTLLSELPKIVGANDAWPHFEPIFSRKSFFEELVNDLNVSRRVAAHMNPVSAEDVKHIEAAFRKWAKTLKAKVNLLP